MEFLSYVYRVHCSAICGAITRIKALAAPLLGVGRDRKISKEEAETLIIDCTEQPIQRPSDDATQQADCSGEHKRHTLKNKYMITAGGRIANVSESDPVSDHDLTIRRQGRQLPSHARIYADRVYQGYDKDRPNIDILYKKPKGGELTDGAREYKRGLGSFRIVVEHRPAKTLPHPSQSLSQSTGNKPYKGFYHRLSRRHLCWLRSSPKEALVYPSSHSHRDLLS